MKRKGWLELRCRKTMELAPGPYAVRFENDETAGVCMIWRSREVAVQHGVPETLLAEIGWTEPDSEEHKGSS